MSGSMSSESAKRAESADALHAPEPERAKPADAGVSRRYSTLARRDTSPEVELRRALWRMGLRYRVQYKVPGLPRRKVDIAFTRRRVAVQVDGCFWHGCPQHGSLPNRNGEWWRWKIERNRARDADTDARLAELGWSVVRVWEHEDPADATARVLAELSRRREAAS